MKTTRGLAAQLLLGGVALVLTVPAAAADTAEADAAADSAGVPGAGGRGDLQEIVVTAQRRAENLERTPLAVSVLGADALAARAIVTETDLRSAVPGLNVRATINSDQLNYSIRGQTVDAFSGSRPAVLPYVNEVQVGGSGGASAFYDLQSVQVLKGPQGTLFGRNATGGAVLFTTAKPVNAFEGYVSAGTGNYGLERYEAAVNAPLVDDKLLLRVAGFYESRNGYQFDTFTNHTVGDVNRGAARLSLTAKLSDSLKNDLVVDFLHSGGSSVSLVLHAVAPQFSNNAAIPANLLYTPTLDTIIGFPGAFAAYTAANPKVPPGGIYAFLALQNARGPYVISTNNPDAHDANNLLVADIFTAELGDDLQFKNVFGFNNLRSEDGDDADGSPYGIDGTPTGQRYGLDHEIKEYSEEPQLIGKALAGNLSYVTGLYYSSDKSFAEELSSYADLSPLAPPTNQHNNTETKDQSYAGYGQGTFGLEQATGIAGLGVTAGMRYTREKVTIDQLPGSSFYGLPAPFQEELSRTFDKVSWQAGLQEQFDPNLLGYLVSRRSFRSGGFNDLAPPLPGFGNAGGAAFDAETATDVELGVKYQGNWLDRPSRLNAAVYSEEIKNIQRVVYAVVGGAPAGLTTNVPKARVSGFEAEGQIAAANWLTLGANVAFADAAFVDNRVTVASTPPTPAAFGPYPDTPRWSGSVYSEFSMPVADALKAVLRAELYDQTKSYFSSTNATITPDTEIPGYALLNFNLALDDGRQGWTVAANLKNALNRVYAIGGIGIYNVATINGVIPGEPRTYQVTLRYRFR